MQFRNALLSALSAEDLAALSPHLTEVVLPRGQSIYEVGDEVQAVYFPTAAVLSVITPLLDGAGVESETIGYEGAAGLTSGLSRLPASTRAIAQVGGTAIRLPAARLRQQVLHSPALLGLVFRHVDLVASQAQQSVACNAAHSSRARLARWLLMTQDRVGGSDVSLTQEYLSIMLGVQRTTITALCIAFKAAGLIRYRRGVIGILDRPRLETEACECYRAGVERLRLAGRVTAQLA